MILPASAGKSFSVQDSDFGRHVIQTTQYSDGTTKVTEYDGLEKKVGTPIHDTSASTAESYSFGLNLGSGLHYVSYGVWNTLYLNPNQQYTSTGSRELFFVTGRRTNAGEIPITGTADYIAKINGIGLTDMDGTLPGLPFLAMRLHADFANRLINGSIDVPFVAETASSGPLAGIAANGGAPIEQGGDYRIPLTGQFNTGPNGIIALTGTVLGAFFGPAAEETGGVIQLNAAGQPVFAGSFVAGKTTP